MSKGRAIALDVVNKMIESFRACPGNAARAASLAGCDVRTARKAWDFGLPSTTGCGRPLREVIEEEQIETRARLEKLRIEQEQAQSAEEIARRKEVAEKARADATESRVQEAQMIRLARFGSAQLLATITTIGKNIPKLAEKVRGALEVAYGQETITIAEAKGFLSIINGMATAMRQANDAAQKSMEMERLLLGEPQSITGVAHFEALTMSEAEARIKAAMDALEHAKERGLIIDAEPQKLMAG